MEFYIARELFQMMTRNEERNEDDRYVFVDAQGTANARARQIGEYLYEEGGNMLMHDVMRILQEKVRRVNVGKEWMTFDLRQLEICWNDIGEWMA
jgi:hypothetical protein